MRGIHLGFEAIAAKMLWVGGGWDLLPEEDEGKPARQGVNKRH